MPTKKDPRDKTSAIIHAITNRVLSNHTAKNIYGNVNYCKYSMQGTVVDVFNGHAPGGGNAIWKLTVDFEMPSDESGLELKRFVINWQHCTLGPVPAGKNPQCSVTFTDLIGDPNHAVKGSTTYLPNAEGRVAAASAVAATTTTNDSDDYAAAAAPCVSLSPAPVNSKIEVILLPPTPPPSPVGKTATKKKRKKAAAPDDASTGTPQLPTAPAGKKSKATKKKKAAKPIDLRALPMWVLTTNLKKHCVMAIAHEQKWVIGNADTITGDVANEPSSNHQWSHKGLFGGRIAPGNPESLAMFRHPLVYDPISGAHVMANNVCDEGPDDDSTSSSHPASPLLMMDQKILMEYGPYRDLVSRRDALYRIVGMPLAPDVAKDVAEGLVDPQ
jgi:hypothetical protein